ncbi:DUF3710 domain-containing protein [Dermabacteraceae bacterium P13264]
MAFFKKKQRPLKQDAVDTVDEAAPEPRAPHLEHGPYDESAVPDTDEQYVDLGGLRIPAVRGLELRMEVEQATGVVTAANLLLEGSSLQLQAFAAPRSGGLWEAVRTTLRESTVDQGGTVESATGPFGEELKLRLPVTRPDGKTGYRPARLLGVDGPRWFLRAVISGPACEDEQHAQALENLLSRVVVVRGRDAMPPEELIPLQLPGGGQPVSPLSGEGSPLERGRSISEIG